MLDSDSYGEQRNGRSYNTNSGHTLTENGIVEDNRAAKSSEINEAEVPEIRTLTQEVVNEQIEGFIAPLTRQLKEMTPLVQGIATTPHPSL